MDIPTRPSAVVRMGKDGKKAPRPVKVSFPTPIDARIFLSKAEELKNDANESITRIRCRDPAEAQKSNCTIVKRICCKIGKLILATDVYNHALNEQSQDQPLMIENDTVETTAAAEGEERARNSSPEPSSSNVANERWISACMMNCQSVGNKALTIKDYTVEHDFDCVFLTETWLTSTRQRICGDLTPTGYKLRALNRKEKRGGGVAVLHKSNIRVDEVKDLTTDSLEGLEVTISSTRSVRILLLYRLKVSVSNPRDAFLNDLQDILECLIVKPKSFIILGDFNIHWDVEADRERMKLLDMAEAFQLVQHVTGATHRDGHTIDLILSRDGDNLVADAFHGLQISDHRAVHFSINAAKPHPPRKKITFRKLRNVVQVALKRDLR
ncbi:hypothetical protein CAPTEDRAFT_212358 [Capitella teleta]|uniref:Endonuclease/exonuclease/phosphatase domain-containing protein n=1 Tax=Capitella teleta TaxID=283909 RepID=R7T4F3_CAPTE|nr:hypothetical protein CAPTEDRAFT_212358 [Capitella teleta]|eukprot:ELT87783.1 hypothetical protein CAPTEDRAFT_212358 [Capitella teleta]